MSLFPVSLPHCGMEPRPNDGRERTVHGISRLVPFVAFSDRRLRSGVHHRIALFQIPSRERGIVMSFRSQGIIQNTSRMVFFSQNTYFINTLVSIKNSLFSSSVNSMLDPEVDGNVVLCGVAVTALTLLSLGGGKKTESLRESDGVVGATAIAMPSLFGLNALTTLVSSDFECRLG